MFTTLVVDRPLTSVAVTMTSYEVSADASPVVGMVNDPARPVSGPTNGWKCVPWCNRTSVLMSRVVEVEAGGVAGERVVGDRVARPVQLALGGRGDRELGRQTDLDDDGLRRRLVAGRRDGQPRRVHALVRVGLGRVRAVLVVPSPKVQR